MADHLDLLDLTRALSVRRGMRRGTPAAEWYERGLALESADPGAAAGAYERALAGQPGFADAHNNLGRVLHETGSLVAAESHYRLAICANERVALYWFNLGVVIEDEARVSEAIAAYERAIAIDPAFVDAHFNLARLLELVGRLAGNELLLRRAVRHLTT